MVILYYPFQCPHLTQKNTEKHNLVYISTINFKSIQPSESFHSTLIYLWGFYDMDQQKMCILIKDKENYAFFHDCQAEI